MRGFGYNQLVYLVDCIPFQRHPVAGIQVKVECLDVVFGISAREPGTVVLDGNLRPVGKMFAVGQEAVSLMPVGHVAHSHVQCRKVYLSKGGEGHFFRLFQGGGIYFQLGCPECQLACYPGGERGSGMLHVRIGGVFDVGKPPVGYFQVILILLSVGQSSNHLYGAVSTQRDNGFKLTVEHYGLFASNCNSGFSLVGLQVSPYIYLIIIGNRRSIDHKALSPGILLHFDGQVADAVSVACILVDAEADEVVALP